MAGQGKAVVSRERERRPCHDNRLHRTPGIAAAAPRSTNTAPGRQVWHRSPIIPELNEPFYRLLALAIQERTGYKHRAARGGRTRLVALYSCREAALYVACSTLCFARYPLEQALRTIAELEFGKVDIALHEKGPHLRPSEVVKDVGLALQRIRIGPSLSPAAFDVEIETA